MRSIKTLTLIIGLCLAAVETLTAQEEGEPTAALQKGKYSMVFALPGGGGGSMGLWKLLSDRTNVGLSIRVNQGTYDIEYEYADGALRSENRTNWGVSVTPAFKRYLSRQDNKTIFFYYGGVGLQYNSTKASLSDDERRRQNWNWNINPAAGIGVEWFLRDGVSIGGYTGLRGTFSHYENDYRTSQNKSSSWYLTTFTSALFLHIYL